MKFDFGRILTESQVKDFTDILVDLAIRIEANGAKAV